MFFFKQKTEYEWRISDWSSDVCSADLIGQDDFALNFDPGTGTLIGRGALAARPAAILGCGIVGEDAFGIADCFADRLVGEIALGPDAADQPLRSAERRVGKECVSPCSSRWSTDH